MMSPTPAVGLPSSQGRFNDLVSELQQEHAREVKELREEISRLQAEMHTMSLPELPSVVAEVPVAIAKKDETTTPAAKTTDSFNLKGAWTTIPDRNGVWGFELDKETAREYIQEMVKHRKSIKSIDDISEEDAAEGLWQEFRRKCRAPDGFVINPTRKTRVAWDLVGLGLICYDTITIPLLIAFEPPDDNFLKSMAWITLMFWSFDMIFSLFTGYYVHGKLMMRRDMIRLNYLKGWFWCDVVVVFPDWFFKVYSAGHAGHETQMGHLARMLKIGRSLRLLRVLKLKKILLFLYDLIDSEWAFIVFGLVKMLLIILVLNHFVACAWFGLGRLSMHNQSTWDTGKNWLQDRGQVPVYGESLGWQYTTSLHWSITQFTPASMDVSATNIIERSFSILVLFWALLAISSIIANITASMTAIRNMSKDETKHLWMIRRYLRRHDVSADLTKRILCFVEWHQNYMKDIVKEKDVILLGTLTSLLKTELRAEMGTPIISGRHPFFKYMVDDTRLRSMISKICFESLQLRTYGQNDMCFEVETQGEATHFVASGVWNYCIAGDMPIGKGILERATWLAEGALWTSWRHYGTLYAKTPGELYAMAPSKFADIMRLHPRSYHLGKNYGQRFIDFLNSSNPSKLSDVLLDFVTDIPPCDEYKPKIHELESKNEATTLVTPAGFIEEEHDDVQAVPEPKMAWK